MKTPHLHAPVSPATPASLAELRNGWPQSLIPRRLCRSLRQQTGRRNHSEIAGHGSGQRAHFEVTLADTRPIVQSGRGAVTGRSVPSKGLHLKRVAAFPGELLPPVTSDTSGPAPPVSQVVFEPV